MTLHSDVIVIYIILKTLKRKVQKKSGSGPKQYFCKQFFFLIQKFQELFRNKKTNFIQASQTQPKCGLEPLLLIEILKMSKFFFDLKKCGRERFCITAHEQENLIQKCGSEKFCITTLDQGKRVHLNASRW